MNHDEMAPAVPVTAFAAQVDSGAKVAPNTARAYLDSVNWQPNPRQQAPCSEAVCYCLNGPRSVCRIGVDASPQPIRPVETMPASAVTAAKSRASQADRDFWTAVGRCFPGMSMCDFAEAAARKSDLIPAWKARDLASVRVILQRCGHLDEGPIPEPTEPKGCGA